MEFNSFRQEIAGRDGVNYLLRRGLVGRSELSAEASRARGAGVGGGLWGEWTGPTGEGWGWGEGKGELAGRAPLLQKRGHVFRQIHLFGICWHFGQGQEWADLDRRYLQVWKSSISCQLHSYCNRQKKKNHSYYTAQSVARGAKLVSFQSLWTHQTDSSLNFNESVCEQCQTVLSYVYIDKVKKEEEEEEDTEL